MHILAAQVKARPMVRTGDVFGNPDLSDHMFQANILNPT